MRNRAYSVALHLAKAISRKALLIATVSGLAVGTSGVGFWTHRAYAAKVKAERAAQAATLNDVMAKLNRIESELQQQTQMLNAKLRAMEYQNAKLAAYEVRAHSDAARFELAAERFSSERALPGATPQTSFTVPVEVETEVCGAGSLVAEAKVGIDPKLEVSAEGDLGATVFGDGVDGKLTGAIGGSIGLGVGGDTSYEARTCLKVPGFGILPSATATQFSALVQQSQQPLAVLLASTYNTLTGMRNGAIVNSVNALQNVQTALTKDQFLQNLEKPQQIFQGVSNLISTIPLPQGISNLFQDPSSLFPQPTDLNSANICASIGTGGAGLISNACNLVPSALADLNGISTSIGQFANVQVDLANFKTTLTNAKTGFSNLCSSVNQGLNTLNNTNITVPQLLAFQVPDGIAPTSTVDIFGNQVPLTYGLHFHTDSVGPATITNPFALPPIACPSF